MVRAVRLGTLGDYVVECGNFRTFVARIDPSMNVANIARSYNSDSDFVHLMV